MSKLPINDPNFRNGVTPEDNDKIDFRKNCGLEEIWYQKKLGS